MKESYSLGTEDREGNNRQKTLTDRMFFTLHLRKGEHTSVNPDRSMTYPHPLLLRSASGSVDGDADLIP